MSTRVINSLRTSPNGRDKIKVHEGLRLKVYRDVAGHWTIGYGHKLRKHEIGKLKVIDQAQAETLLTGDLSVAEIYINGTARNPLNQNQFDALVSFAFNIGVGKLESSTLWRHIQNGNFKLAAAQFGEWIYVTDPETGKKKMSTWQFKRRAAEKNLFLTPIETAK